MKFALAALPLLSVALAQSSASSAVASAAESVTGSASSTASGEMPMQSGMAGADYLTAVLGALK
jgi:crotonobetainyl-CoA:carnitine CoA-transferase CaiB-like acyl-CoA transferase